MDYEGAISNESAGDGGVREYVPPGLQLGEGELTKVVIRFKTYETMYPGDIFVKMEISGIDRFATNGKFSSDSSEKESTGRIRVWSTPQKKELLLDSGDPQKRSVEWKVDKEKYSRGEPGNVPRVVYVEGVEKSPKFEGDLRLLVSSSHSMGGGETRAPSSMYHTAFDHILFTVRESPIPKAFINNNAEGVWPGAGKPAKQVAAE